MCRPISTNFGLQEAAIESNNRFLLLIFLGIISRETRAGAALGSNGYGADGHGYGLMQVIFNFNLLN